MKRFSKLNIGETVIEAYHDHDAKFAFNLVFEEYEVTARERDRYGLKFTLKNKATNEIRTIYGKYDKWYKEGMNCVFFPYDIQNAEYIRELLGIGICMKYNSVRKDMKRFFDNLGMVKGHKDLSF